MSCAPRASCVLPPTGVQGGVLCVPGEPGRPAREVKGRLFPPQQAHSWPGGHKPTAGQEERCPRSHCRGFPGHAQGSWPGHLSRVPHPRPRGLLRGAEPGSRASSESPPRETAGPPRAGHAHPVGCLLRAGSRGDGCQPSQEAPAGLTHRPRTVRGRGPDLTLARACGGLWTAPGRAEGGFSSGESARWASRDSWSHSQQPSPSPAGGG